MTILYLTIGYFIYQMGYDKGFNTGKTKGHNERLDEYYDYAFRNFFDYKIVDSDAPLTIKDIAAKTDLDAYQRAYFLMGAMYGDKAGYDPRYKNIHIHFDAVKLAWKLYREDVDRIKKQERIKELKKLLLADSMKVKIEYDSIGAKKLKEKMTDSTWKLH